MNMDNPKTFHFMKDGKSEEMIYYDGLIRYGNKPDKPENTDAVKFDVEASFLCFDEMKYAAAIVKCAKRFNHKSVLKAHFYCVDKDISKTIVCVERFTSFLRDTHAPLPSFKSQIKDIFDAITEMHVDTKAISCSNLDLEISYFLCPGDRVKIMPDQLWLRDDGDFDDGIKIKWLRIKDSNSRKFINYLEGYFAQSIEFAKFFKSSNVVNLTSEQVLSLMLSHPFLVDEPVVIMEWFLEVHCCLYSAVPDMRVAPLSKELSIRFQNRSQNPSFGSEFMRWTITSQNNAFTTSQNNAFTQFRNGSHSNDVWGLMKFIRDLCEHRDLLSLTLKQIYTLIQANWPYLFYRLHEFTQP